MEVIEYVEKIDTLFDKVNKDYKYIYDKIHNYLNDDKITYENLIDFEVSLSDLSIHLNSLVFLFKQQEQQEKQAQKEVNKDKLDFIVETSLFNIFPLLFMYFMFVDKNSIFYIKDFVNTTKNKTTNQNNNDNNNDNATENIKDEEYYRNKIKDIFNEEYILNDLD
jgi:hypothetical protein